MVEVFYRFTDAEGGYFPVAVLALGTTRPRIVSPRETESLLGFPPDWTDMPDEEWHALDMSSGSSFEAEMKRRNAVGNAIAVPVLMRLIMACVVSAATASASNLWDDPSLQRPYHIDVAWDVFAEAGSIAKRQSHIIADWGAYAPEYVGVLPASPG